MTLTLTQRAALRRQGITVVIEYANGVAKCLLPGGDARLYAIDDLAERARPRTLRERIAGLMGGVA